MTGSTGFVGGNLLPILSKRQDYKIWHPEREELNLRDENEMADYLKEHKFDVVLNFASPSPGKNALDSYEKLMEDALRIFMNFYSHRDLYKKMIFTGSGAEYDKSLPIDKVNEEECFRSIPKDAYGLSKRIMNHLAQESQNIYNYRIFGCYGPRDHESKFITHCIRSVLLNIPITIRRNCQFDYIQVEDFAKYIEWGIDNDMQYHSYNVTSGDAYYLTDIAQMVIDEMKSDLNIELLSDEANNNYTANNTRIVSESGIYPSVSLKKGIQKQIQWEIENWSEDTIFDGK